MLSWGLSCYDADNTTSGLDLIFTEAINSVLGNTVLMTTWQALQWDEYYAIVRKVFVNNFLEMLMN